ncbi:unnamed protein product, partial [Chrysoparadoxa australica]
ACEHFLPKVDHSLKREHYKAASWNVANEWKELTVRVFFTPEARWDTALTGDNRINWSSLRTTGELWKPVLTKVNADQQAVRALEETPPGRSQLWYEARDRVQALELSMQQRHKGGVDYGKDYLRVTRKPHARTKAGKLVPHMPDIEFHNIHKEEHCKVYVHAVELDRVTGNGVGGQLTVEEKQWVRLELAKPHMIV